MPARVLHLVDLEQSSWPALDLLGDLMRSGGCTLRHPALVIGGPDAGRDAQAHGIDPFDRFAPISGAAILGSRTLRRFLAIRREPDAIVAWSIRAVVMAHLAGVRAPVIAAMTLPPPAFEGALQWTIAARALRRCALVVYPTAFLRDSWVARFTLLGCPGAVVAPAPHIATGSTRESLRAEWGADTGTVVIMALGEPIERVDAHAAVFAAGVLGVAGRSALVVAHPRSARLDRALRFAARIRPRRRVIVDDRPAPELLPACDLALWIEPEGEATRPGGSAYTTPLGAASLAWADATGLPIVAHEHPAWRSLLADSPRCIGVRERTRHDLTRAILAALELPKPPVAPPGRPWTERFEHVLLHALKTHAADATAARCRAIALSIAAPSPEREQPRPR